MYFKMAELGSKYLDNIFAKHSNNTPSNVSLERLDTHFHFCVFSFAITASCDLELNDKKEERLHNANDIKPLFTLSGLAHL